MIIIMMVSPPDCTEDDAEYEAEYKKTDDDEKPDVWRGHFPVFLRARRCLLKMTN